MKKLVLLSVLMAFAIPVAISAEEVDNGHVAHECCTPKEECNKCPPPEPKAPPKEDCNRCSPPKPTPKQKCQPKEKCKKRPPREPKCPPSKPKCDS